MLENNWLNCNSTSMQHIGPRCGTVMDCNRSLDEIVPLEEEEERELTIFTPGAHVTDSTLASIRLGSGCCAGLYQTCAAVETWIGCTDVDQHIAIGTTKR